MGQSTASGVHRAGPAASPASVLWDAPRSDLGLRGSEPAKHGKHQNQITGHSLGLAYAANDRRMPLAKVSSP